MSDSNGTPKMNGVHCNHAPFIIGVCGGTASGKTTVCSKIIEHLGLDNQRVSIISQDCFYSSLSQESKKKVYSGDYNFDHPDAFDWNLLEETLKELRDGKATKIPTYDFVTHSRKDETYSKTISSIDIILFEGILAFYQPNIRDLMNMKIFVDTDADTRLSRRILRDISERGRDLEGVLVQYQRFVKPSFDDYILPTKKYADVIIPRGSENSVAIDLLVQHIRSKLVERKKHLADRHGMSRQ